MLKRSTLGLVFMAASAAAASALAMQAPSARSGAAAASAATTVNSYTPAQERRARVAVERQGYRDARLVMAQDGNLFFNAAKDGRTFQLTVTREGEVHAGAAAP